MTHQHGRAIVLLEGLDKCGKTTTAGELAAKLSDSGPVHLIHFGKPNGEDQFRAYLEAIREADDFQGSTIIDRLHWSEEAYGLVYRPGTCLGLSAANALDEVLMRIGGVVVLKTRPDDEIFDALDAHDQTTKSTGAKITLADIQNLSGCYRSRFNNTQLVSHQVPFKQAVPSRFLGQAAAFRSKSILQKENH